MDFYEVGYLFSQGNTFKHLAVIEVTCTDIIITKLLMDRVKGCEAHKL